MKVYFISGLGADSRVFKHIVLPDGCDPVFIDWIKPYENESLGNYAARLSAGIDTTEPFALAGLSMGGMIVCEIAKLHQPKVCILLSSVTSHTQLPPFFKVAFRFSLHKILPVDLLKKGSMLKRNFGGYTPEDNKILKDVIRDTEPGFIKWAMHAILSWKNDTVPKNLWHIHGTRDEVLPFRYCKPTHIIKGGNHTMIISEAEKINRFLEEALLSSGSR